MAEIFRLEKHYLDCIDDKGNCLIVYQANLRIAFLPLSYSSVFFSGCNGFTVEKSSYKKIPGLSTEGTIYVKNKQLKISGSWKVIDEALPPFTYRNQAGQELTWNCHHPGAMAEIEYMGNSFRGLGYADTVFLTISPWDFPSEELGWGRFLSDHYSITWMLWTGGFSVNKIFCNGKEYNDACIEPGRIVFGKGYYVLEFGEPCIIKKGRLANVLYRMPFLRLFFKSRILNAFETKYKSRSTLFINSEISATGWSLFETVTWGT